MVQFHETVMGRRFFDSTMPALADELNKLKHSNEQLAQALFEELHKLNENLKPKKVDRIIADAGNICQYLAEGYKPLLTYRDHRGEGTDYIICEKEVE